MNINNDTTKLGNTNAYETIDNVNSIYSIIIYSILLSMSFGYMALNYELILGLFIVATILKNVQYNLMKPETLQAITNGAFTYILNKDPILGPLKMITAFAVLATLITGNLFAWETYLVFIVITVVMDIVYKKKYGVVEKNDTI